MSKNKLLYKQLCEQEDIPLFLQYKWFDSLYNNDVQTAINEYIQSRGSDIVAFINKKHSFFSMILSRPMVKNLGYYTHIPVLALHDFRRR